MNKNIALVVAESGQVRDLAVPVGATAREVLTQVGLDDRYVLTTGQGHEPFGQDEVIYDRITDGAKLIASTPVEVGAFPSLVELLRRASIPDYVRNLDSPQPDHNSEPDPIQSPLWQPPAPVPRFVPRQAVMPPHATTLRRARTSREVVRRDSRPYWQQREWSQNGAEYHGFYRTRLGGWRGKATTRWGGRLDFFIHQPPSALRHHPSWHCFFERPGEWYFIHFVERCDLSSGILKAEQLLTEAHG